MERWFLEVSDNPDYLESERRFDWYPDRQQWDLYDTQKQENMLDIFRNASGYMGCYHEEKDPNHEPVWTVESRKRKIEICNVLLPGSDRILMGNIGCRLN